MSILVVRFHTMRSFDLKYRCNEIYASTPPHSGRLLLQSHSLTATLHDPTDFFIFVARKPPRMTLLDGG